MNEELNLLKEAFPDEIKIKRSDDDWETEEPANMVIADVNPASDGVSDNQFVSVQLLFTLPNEYPNALPNISICKPCGLSQGEVSSLSTILCNVAEEQQGDPMLYDIIARCREFLTERNLPAGQCSICIEDFGANEEATPVKTSCCHFFHADCLADFVEYTLSVIEKEQRNRPLHMRSKSQEVQCPVCRLPINYDLVKLRSQEATSSTISAEIIKLREQEEILSRQMRAKESNVVKDYRPSSEENSGAKSRTTKEMEITIKNCENSSDVLVKSSEERGLTDTLENALVPAGSQATKAAEIPVETEKSAALLTPEELSMLSHMRLEPEDLSRNQRQSRRIVVPIYRPPRNKFSEHMLTNYNGNTPVSVTQPRFRKNWPGVPFQKKMYQRNKGHEV